MKKHTSNKLRLARETLAPLQDDVLASVAGGIVIPPVTTTATTIVSRVVCPSLPLCVGK
jgi:hypothetical protein